RRCRTARAVDAQDDRAQRRVAPGLPDVLNERVRTDDRPVQRIEATLPAVDRPSGIDHGDSRTPVEADRRKTDARVVVVFKAPRGPVVAQLVVDLILVRQLVDQALAQSLLGQKGALIEQTANLRLVLLAPVRDSANQLIVEIA